MIKADDRGSADFEWLDRDSILDLHQRSIEDYGGSFGIRDEGLLDSAVDGNKRTAFMAMVVFLALNGWALDVWQWKATRVIRKVATGDIDEKELARWIRKHSRRLSDEEQLELLESDDEERDDDAHHQEIEPR